VTEADGLERLLAEWAARYQLTPAQVADVRALAVASGTSVAELDAEWLWSLLRPVTDLLEQFESRPMLSYLQLA